MYDPAFPVLSALGIVLVLLPAPWHWKNRNTGTLLYIGWTLVANLIFFLNSLIWNGNLRNDLSFWCDLTTKLLIGFSVGLPAASLAINRRLYHISTVKQVAISASDARNNIIFDLCIGVGLPIICMALHVVSQGHRYDIFEDVGCWPSTYITPVAIPTVFMWPILLGLVSFVYASRSIWAFLKQRRQFNELLKTSSSGLNVSRYFRLMALASTEMLFALPMSLLMLINNIRLGLRPWISWEDTHARFNRAEFVSQSLFRLFPQIWINVSLTRYVAPGAAFLFFLYFGLAGESGVFYKRWFWAVAGLFGFKPSESAVSTTSWAARGGASSGGMGSVGPLASFNVSSSTPGVTKKTSSVEIYPSGLKKSSPSSDGSSIDDGQSSDLEKLDSPRLPSLRHSIDLPNVPDSTSPPEVSKDVV